MVFRALLIAFVVGGVACSPGRPQVYLPLYIMMDGASEYFILNGFESDSRCEIIKKIKEIHEQTGFDLKFFCFIMPDSSWGPVFSFLDETRELDFVTIVINRDYPMEMVEDPVPLNEVIRIDEAEEHK